MLLYIAPSNRDLTTTAVSLFFSYFAGRSSLSKLYANLP
jgi:hypothetical protein